MSLNARTPRPPILLAALGAVVLTTGACKQEQDPFDEAVEKAVTGYADIAYQSHRDTAKAADVMLEEVNTFMEITDPQNFNRIKVQWSVTRERWAMADAFVFPGSPSEEMYPLINAGNIDPGFVDYTTTDLSSGIVNATDQYPNITKEILTDLNQINGTDKVSVGFHPLEFLLWGQDFSDEEDGRREYTDYLDNDMGTAQNRDRRRAYLTAATELLVDDVKTIRDEWREEEGEYRKAFAKLDPDEQVRLMIQGLGYLSDQLENARLGTPLFSMDQNGDHLPYSDLSHKDLYFAAVSIQNLYLGRYDEDLLNADVPEEGDGLSRIVAEKSPPLDEQFRTNLDATVTAMRAVHDGEPLEIAILGNIGSAERADAEAALAAVKQQNVTLEEIANLFGFSLEGGNEGGDETGDGSGTGDGTDTGTTTGTDTGTTTSTDTGTDSSDSSDDMGTVFLPNPDMG